MSQPKDTRPVPAGSNKARPWERFVYGGLFLLLVAGLVFLVIYQALPRILDGQLIDPDNYMRLVRVKNLVATGDWFDSTIPRSNAPFGEVLHWTRPLDVLILAGTLLLRPFLPYPEALHWAGVFLPPVLLFLTGLAAAWASKPLTGPDLQFVGMVAVMVQVGILQATLPGRPDHHALHVLLMVLTLGWAIRWTWEPFSWRVAVSTGAAVGAGLWVGMEFLLPMGLLLLAGVFFWIREGGGWAQKNLGFALGLWGIVLLAWLLEHPPARLLEAQYDKVSIAHASMAFLIVVFWQGLSRLFVHGRLSSSDAEGLKPKPHVRLLAAGLGGGLALAVLFAVFPSFFLGPEANIDPQLSSLWRRFVVEDQPLLNSGGEDVAGNIFFYLGSPLICLPFLFWRLVAEDEEQRWNTWFLLSFVLAAFLPLSLFRFRFVAYPEIAAVPVLAAFISVVLSRLGSATHSLLRTPLRAGIVGALFCGPLLLGAEMMEPADADLSSDDIGPMAACPITALARVLDTLQTNSEEPRIIAAHLSYGPEILYRTRHRVIGTPYHRNSEGILSLFSILAGRPDWAREEVVRRGVDWILVCSEQSWVYSGNVLDQGATPEKGQQTAEGDPQEDSGQEVREEAPAENPAPVGDQEPVSLHNRLLAGEIPEWLEPLPLDDDALGEFLLFRVKD